MRTQEVRKSLKQEGFDWQQEEGSTYFGNDTVDAVTCVLAVQRLKKDDDCLTAAVRGIRMLRIEENNDLMPATES